MLKFFPGITNPVDPDDPVMNMAFNLFAMEKEGYFKDEEDDDDEDDEDEVENE